MRGADGGIKWRRCHVRLLIDRRIRRTPRRVWTVYPLILFAEVILRRAVLHDTNINTKINTNIETNTDIYVVKLEVKIRHVRIGRGLALTPAYLIAGRVLMRSSI
jgi:hypothetical protein